MKSLAVLFALSLTLQHCSDRSGMDNDNRCNTEVEVVDLTGLDGCGLILRTKSGEQLLPTEIIPDFELKAGQKLHIGYTETNLPNICMVGPTVRIDCIREAGAELACQEQGKTIFMNPGDTARADASDFKMQDLRFEDGLIKARMGYSGCGPKRDFKLVLDAAVMKSLPPQRNAVIVFEDQMCEAFFQRTVCFPTDGFTEKTLVHIFDKNGNKTSVMVDPR
ncbi:MAG: hypothetical protein H6606_06255 [Flavobacteriales bacterium]|nr:hypothetical protein [Flavobacteriales bacterium]